MVGLLDCQPLLKAHNVEATPASKYFGAGLDPTGAIYTGSNHLDELVQFVKAELEVECNPHTKEHCTAKELKFMDKFEKKSAGYV